MSPRAAVGSLQSGARGGGGYALCQLSCGWTGMPRDIPQTASLPALCQEAGLGAQGKLRRKTGLPPWD